MDHHPLLHPNVIRGATVQANTTESEAAQIIEKPRSETDQILPRVLYGAGLRASEALGLAPGDVDSEQHIVFIRDGKEGKDRYALIDPQTLVWMSARTEQRIFATTRQQVFVILKRAAEKIGLLEKTRLRMIEVRRLPVTKFALCVRAT